jgi:hypothetical protein
MPEITHKDQPSILATPTPTVAAQVAKQPMAAAAQTTAKDIAETIVAKGVITEELEAQIAAILDKRKAARVDAAKPKEPNWATLTELESYNPDVFIPVIEHDMPDYMNIKLKDTEYEPVWASRDQRRLGQLLAEGYEVLKPEHMAVNFKLPLKFESDGSYVYQDVIALRVHKRILFGKRRKALEISQKQLKNTRGIPQQRIKGTFELTGDRPNLEPGLDLYETAV